MINFRVAQAPLAPTTCLVSSRLWRGEKGLPKPEPQGQCTSAAISESCSSDLLPYEEIKQEGNGAFFLLSLLS